MGTKYLLLGNSKVQFTKLLFILSDGSNKIEHHFLKWTQKCSFFSNRNQTPYLWLQTNVHGTLKIVWPITTFLYFLYLLKVLKDGSKTCKVHLSQSEIFTNIYERHAHALFQLKSFFWSLRAKASVSFQLFPHLGIA